MIGRYRYCSNLLLHACISFLDFNEQYRSFRASTQNVLVPAILVHPAPYKFTDSLKCGVWTMGLAYVISFMGWVGCKTVWIELSSVSKIKLTEALVCCL